MISTTLKSSGLTLDGPGLGCKSFREYDHDILQEKNTEEFVLRIFATSVGNLKGIILFRITSMSSHLYVEKNPLAAH